MCIVTGGALGSVQIEAGTTRLQSIQMLRAIAVIAVLLFHFGTLTDGRAGVDLFFCISGFVMAGLMDRTPRQFAIDRFVRIYPPFLVVMALTFLLVPMPFDAGRVALSLLLFPDKDVVYLYPAWSLGFEAMFYIACVLAMRFGWHIILATYAVLFAFDVPYVGSAFVLEFLAGFAIARRAWWVLPILLLGAVSEPRVLSYGTLGAALLWAGIKLEPHLRTTPGPLSKVGDASYAIYLTHVPIGTVLTGNVPPPVTIVGCLLFGLLFYQMIERPLLRWCRSLASIRPIIPSASTT